LFVLRGVTAKDLNRLQQRNAELEKQLQLEREEAVGPLGLNIFRERKGLWTVATILK